MISHVPDFRGADVTVMGLGLHGGGTGVTRYLIEQGAHVTVTDLKPADELRESLNELKDLDVSLTLNEHRKRDFRTADYVIVNPAVPMNSPYLDVARENGAEFESELNLFVKQCPAQVIGITGSAGKSTTTSMIGHILKTCGRRCWIGGNIGGSLLTELGNISAGDHVVLEISSFQLLHLDRINWSPSVSAVTNIFPNHLDRHGTFEAYTQAKKTIISYQQENDRAVLNEEDDTLTKWTCDLPGELLTFSTEKPVEHGTFIKDRQIVFRAPAENETNKIMPVEEVPLPGEFNLENTLLAVSVVSELSGKPRLIRKGIRSFEPLSHHLESVARKSDVEFVDDSVSTTPESTISALEAFDHRPVAIILGGYDKGVSLDGLVRKTVEHAKYACLIGETANRLRELFQDHEPTFPHCCSEDLKTAVETAYRSVRDEPEGVVLLSTASASYDMFTNYKDRGESFQRIARGL